MIQRIKDFLVALRALQFDFNFNVDFHVNLKTTREQKDT
jgi:hypothetical protein